MDLSDHEEVVVKPLTRIDERDADTLLRLAGDMADAVRSAISGLGVGPAVRDVLVTLTAAGCGECASVTQWCPPEGRPATVASTSESAASIDAIGYRLAEGPAVQASTDGQTVIVLDSATEHRWPRWREEAAALGLRTAVCVPLGQNGTVTGSINVYGSAGWLPVHQDLELVDLAVPHVAAILEHRSRNEHLTAALDSRTQIGQAQGILMRQFGISAEQAFGVLRRHSQAGNIKLREIARGIVEGGRLPPDIPVTMTVPPVELADDPGSDRGE
jgi:GAF domain-containing protein